MYYTRINFRDGQGLVKSFRINDDNTYSLYDGQGNTYTVDQVVPCTEAQDSMLFFLQEGDINEAQEWMDEVLKEFQHEEEICTNVYLGSHFQNVKDHSAYVDALYEDLERSERECKQFIAIALLTGYEGTASNAMFEDIDVLTDTYDFQNESYRVARKSELSQQVYDEIVNGKEFWKDAVANDETEQSLEDFANEWADSDENHFVFGYNANYDAEINGETWTVLYNE